MKNKIKEYSLKDIMHKTFIMYAVIPVILIGMIFCFMTGIKTYRNNLKNATNIITFVSAGYEIYSKADLIILENSINELDISKNSSIIICYNDDSIVYSSNPALNRCLEEWDHVKTTLRLNGRNYYIISSPAKEDSLHFYYVITIRELYSGLFRQLHFFIILIMIYSVFAYLCFNRIKKDISTAFDPIIYSLDNYVPGEHMEPIAMPALSIKELSHIVNKINAMVGNVEYHIENEYKLTLEQQKAEYRALQAEINPHFLYNTLNVFTALNRIGDRSSLDTAIISLSKLFRYTCSSGPDSNTTIEKEFKFIENYFYLQKLRFEERLDYRIDLGINTEDITIPKLIIQPLVENCIKHGLEPAEITMTIELSSTLITTPNMGRFIVISIINDGVPFIRRETPGTDGGVGLSNVETRLRAFNPNSFLVIDGGVDKKTQFHIVIPK